MSTTSPDSTALHVAITVDVPVDFAYRVFTERFDEIKPREHNMLTAPIERTVLEPYVGGTVYDVGTDGSVCTWARVLACDPPHALTISWDISPQWRIETDPARTSEVEIRFVAETPARTRVEIDHRHLDRHGEGWEQASAGIGGANGWPLYLDRFRAVAEGASTP
ncbi:SRPBCC family protein [Tsukamurella paurometabola]|uniref:Activator of Hsp90 ATPase homolog 1-like protein n=1 Tax=Tsukamurella paurometabola TaxID=2061 RepID=A0A3P8K1E1_TSUPA|nr:SRPBCC family protein [Tsukamurella paurometabola]UEA82232.1 SRPBCC family protein [Tsukamurella paurometabola]VDR39279.1 Activator of Hsp90 ATPase homolog 1-like protein [Tsukamurella paurometabola]